MDKPLMANVIETATVLRRLVNHSHFEDIYSRQILGEADLFLYSYFLNEVYIDLAALNAPVYYDVEMFAMRYGALGSLYAKEVTKMYDSNGRPLNANGEYYANSFSEESSGYRKKLLCSATGDRRSSLEYFTHVSGLETVFQAYSVAVSRNSRIYDYRLHGLEELSSDELFFVTYCHVLCAPRTDDAAEDMCNVPLRNFRPFAEAFRCTMGSYMNPEKKCRFFALAKEENATFH
ncbi:neprilysin-like [Amblyomma americanum]